MKRNFQSILLILFISSGLFAQGNVLQINSPTTGELVSTVSYPLIIVLLDILILVIQHVLIAMVSFV